MADHPITPPPWLIQRLIAQGLNNPPDTSFFTWFATQFARWGADQELEACVGWLNSTDVDDSQEAAKDLRAARRPKSPSLKEQAIAALQVFGPSGDLTPDEVDTIRSALEALPDD